MPFHGSLKSSFHKNIYMSSLEHIFLYLVLFTAFYIFARNSRKYITTFHFIISSIIPILVFILVEGSRYGRGNDYLPYKYRYEHLSFLDEPQILFYGLMKLLHELNLTYIGAFRVYALIFIIGVIYFIRKSFPPKEAQWMYLFAIFALLLKMEFMIRQYIAMPFIFCFIHFIFEKKWLQAILCLAIANGIHSGTLFGVPFILTSYFLVKKMIHYKYCIIILFLVYYIIPNGIFTNLATQSLEILHLDTILASDHFSHYIDDSDRWLGEESYLAASQQSFLTTTLQFLFEASVIIVGYYALKIHPNQKVLSLYNLAILGFILCRLFHGFEIFNRMFDQLSIYWFIPVGYAFSVYFKPIKRKNHIYKLCTITLTLYLILYWGRYIFLQPDALFYWNHNANLL